MEEKFRTIKECYDYIKSIDKDTAITLYFIRTLCRQEKIDFIWSGKKILIDLYSLLNYFKTNKNKR